MDSKTDTDKQYYVSDDLMVSSFLLCRQAQLIDIASKSNHFTFIFNELLKCQELAREYLNNGLAPARELFARREELMSAMRDRNGYRKTYGQPN